MTNAPLKNPQYGESWQHLITVAASLIWIILEGLSFVCIIGLYMEDAPDYLYLGVTSFFMLGLPGLWAFYRIIREYIWFRDMSIIYAVITAFWGVATIFLYISRIDIPSFLQFLLLGGGFIFLANTIVFACLYEWPYVWSEEIAAPVA